VIQVDLVDSGMGNTKAKIKTQYINILFKKIRLLNAFSIYELITQWKTLLVEVR
jgi:hypothetical protein